ncbi:cystathionine beta-lyase [Pontibacillus yanchengensis]|uniref:Cystathionine beta-lyase n=2 Tax=Pontibacillus yanchengensis TaxID=462910 RepID=A0ACC7VD65_9BACI|nr:cystathionine beta-lyase [Pontibacillus yanchengensis]MYL35088.1 cystathionine beta-lyase [Pontibacillus yanchengensis]MYL52545.1 cystathionine beta-lyase [Pontibacillus yanchengensis]
MSNYSVQTKLLHNDYSVDKTSNGVSVPIQHASTFHQEDISEFGQYDYARSGNPTRDALETTIADLEGGTHGFAFASGMAAVSSSLMLLSKGDHLLITEDVYGGTFRFVTQVLSRFGIEHTFVDMTKLDEVKAAFQSNTKAVFIETPSNPLLKVTDIEAVTQLAKQHDCISYMDNTFLTPLLQKPFDLGVDIIIHSATKFLAGHSDVVAGLVVVNDEQLAQQIGFLQNSCGAILGPQDCWLVLRGIKTLHARMRQSVESAEKLANYLEGHSLITKVYYPGLTSNSYYEVQQKQAKNGGAVLSFELANEQAVEQFVERLKLPVFAVSLGAVESILSYPRNMSHGSMPDHDCDQRGITKGLLRLSVGLEDADELIVDFEQALAYTNQPANTI